MTDREALEAIHQILDGSEWSGETCGLIAEELVQAGFRYPADFSPQDEQEAPGSPGTGTVPEARPGTPDAAGRLP